MDMVPDYIEITFKARGIEWSLKNHGSQEILGESRNFGVTHCSLRILSSQKIKLASEGLFP